MPKAAQDEHGTFNASLIYFVKTMFWHRDFTIWIGLDWLKYDEEKRMGLFMD